MNKTASAPMPIIRLSVLHGIVQMTKIVANFFIALHLVDMGFSGAEIGFIAGLYSLATLITVLPSGISNDTFKSRHLITTSLILIILQFAALGLSQNFWVLAIMFSLGGIGNALFTASAESLFHKASEKKDLSKKIAIFQGIEYFLIAAGVIAAGALLHFNLSFENLFLYIAAAFVLLTIASFTLPNSATAKLELIHYKKGLLRKDVLFFFLIVFIFSIHFGAEFTSYGLFLEENLKLDKLQIGLYMGSAIAFMSLASIVIHKNSTKWKPRQIMLWGLFLSGFFHIVMAVEMPIWSFIARTIHEIGDAAFFFFLYVGINKLFDLDKIGGYNGMMRLMTQIGSAIGAFIFGPMGDTYGYNWPLIISGGTSLLAFVLALYFSHLIDNS